MNLGNLTALEKGNPLNSSGADIANSVNGFSTIQEIPGSIGDNSGVAIKLSSWRGNNSGGGSLVWNSLALKSAHNGGTIFSPTVPYINDLDYMDAAGETDPAGSGCWIREGAVFETNANMFGAHIDGVTNDTGYIQRYFDHASNGHVFKASGEALIQSVTIDGHSTCSFECSGLVILPVDTSTCLIIDNAKNCNSIKFGRFGRQGYPTQGGIPYEIKSTVNCEIDMGVAYNFSGGVLINPVGSGGGRSVVGSQYNKIRLRGVGDATNTVDAVTITTTTGIAAPSWFNENELYLDDLRCTGTGIKFVKGVGQTDPFNGNMLFKPGLEAVDTNGIELDFCENNSILYPRFENAGVNFSSSIVRDNPVTDNCAYNTMILGRARIDKLDLTGAQNYVIATMVNASGSHVADRLIGSGQGDTPLYISDQPGVGTSGLLNNTLFTNGDTLNTGNGKMLEQWRGYWKNSAGVVEPFGLMKPFDELIINSATSGDEFSVGKASFIRTSAPTDIVLNMDSNRQISGYSCYLEIRHASAEVTVRNAAGTLNISPSAFQIGGDSLGMFLLVYRDFAWRTTRVGGVLINS